MTDNQNTVDIAVIREQINGIREQQKAHAENTNKQNQELKIQIEDLNIAVRQLTQSVTALSLSAKISWKTLCAISVAAAGLISMCVAIASYFKG